MVCLQQFARLPSVQLFANLSSLLILLLFPPPISFPRTSFHSEAPLAQLSSRERQNASVYFSSDGGTVFEISLQTETFAAEEKTEGGACN